MENQGDVEGGQLVLLQSILSAIPLFYFSVFKVPIGVRKRRGALVRHFLWKRPWTGIEPLLGDGFMGCRLLTCQARGAADFKFIKYEYGYTDEVGD